MTLINDIDSGRLVRSILLLVWIIGLVYVGVAAITSNASRWLLGMNSVAALHSVDPVPADKTEKPMPIRLYERWAKSYTGRGPMAPVSTVLDAMWPKWDSMPPDADARLPEIWVEDWMRSFRLVETWLAELASRDDEAGRIYTVSSETVPAPLRDYINYTQFTTLPRTAVIWIEAQRAAAADTTKLFNLTDTGIIVIVIGALGSVLFLVNTTVTTGGNALTVENFLFRPLLGALLAVAFLIADIVTHAVVSTGNILQVRRESMYGLALAAGLLSEVAYRRLSDWLAKRFPKQ